MRFPTSRIVFIFVFSIVVSISFQGMIPQVPVENNNHSWENDYQTNTLDIQSDDDERHSSEKSVDFSNYIINTDSLKVNQLAGYKIKTIKELNIQSLMDKYPGDAKVAVRDGKLRIISETTSTNTLHSSSILEVSEISLSNIDSISAMSSSSSQWEPDFIIEKDLVPNDPYYQSNDLWAIDRLQMPTVWDTQLGGSDVLVAILDSGVDYNHPDLVDNFVDIGYDFVNDDSDVMDGDGHGTHVAGTIAASINNGIGVAGMANVSFFAQKILNDTGSGFYSWAIDAIYDAVEKGADILSNSWGGEAYSSQLEDAVNYATSQGVLFIAAAGNDNTDTPHYPASFDNAISVAATTLTDQKASYSNFGSTIDIAAPGSGIWSTIPNANYASYSGTSMATPHVSAVAALLWSHFSFYDNNEITNLLYSTAEDLGDPGYDIHFGNGLVSPLNALQGLYVYDMTVRLEQTDYNENTGDRTLNIIISNIGKSDANNIQYELVLDNQILANPTISVLNSGDTFESSINILGGTSQFNFTAYVFPYQNESRLVDNQAEIIGKYIGTTSNIEEPVLGGLVPIDLQVDEFQNLTHIDVFVNGNSVISVSPTDTLYSFYVPVFNNGTNIIELQPFWTDTSFVNYTIVIQSEKVVPLLHLENGDYINWRYDFDTGVSQQQHWTLNSKLTGNQVNFTLTLTEFDSNGVLFQGVYWAIVDLSSGYYVSTNFGWDGERFAWISNMEDYRTNSAHIFGNTWDQTIIVNDYTSELGQVFAISTSGGIEIQTKFPSGILYQITNHPEFSLGILEDTSLSPVDHEITQIETSSSLQESSNLSTWSFYLNNTGEFAETIETVDITVDKIGNDDYVGFSYQLSLDGNPTMEQDQWYPYQVLEIAIDISNFDPGEYSISLSIEYVSSGNNGILTDTGDLEILDTSVPVITTPFVDVNIYEGRELLVYWLITEYEIGEVNLYLDESLVNYDITDNNVSYLLSGLDIGTYSLELVVTDTSGNSATSEIVVTVVTEPEDNDIGVRDNPSLLSFWNSPIILIFSLFVLTSIRLGKRYNQRYN